MTVYAPFQPDDIPEPLKTLPRWIQWSTHLTDSGKKTKRPNSSTKSGPHAPLLDLLETAPSKPLDPRERGYGLVLTSGVAVDGGRLVALDLDACRNPTTGQISDWAKAVIRKFSSYTEITPSGTGFRIFGTVPKLKPLRVIKFGPPPQGMGDHKQAELQVMGYGAASYVTVTGWRLPGAPNALKDCADGLRWLTEAYPNAEAPTTVEHQPTPVGRAPSVDELHRAIQKVVHQDSRIGHLIDGDWERVGFPSASEGWLVLVTTAIAQCAGHLNVATEWLLTHTAYGKGQVDSKDPARYQRPGWVETDISRIYAKQQSAIRDVFSPLPLAAGEKPLSEGQRSPFERQYIQNGQVEPIEPIQVPTTTVDQGDPDSMDTASVMGLSPVNWLIEGYLPKNAICTLVAPPDSYKSFLAIDWAMHLVTGKENWFDHEISTDSSEPPPVMVVLGEGIVGLRSRLGAWGERHGVTDDLWAGTPPFSVTRTAHLIAEREGITKLIEIIDRQCRRWGRTPEMIVVDTLNRNFGSGDENTAADMTRFFIGVDALRVRYQATVLVVHHTGKDAARGARGSSVIDATIDAGFALVRKKPIDPNDPAGLKELVGSPVTQDDAEDAILDSESTGSDAEEDEFDAALRRDAKSVLLYCTKMKEAEKPPPLQLVLEVQEFDDRQENDPTATGSSLVIDSAEKPRATPVYEEKESHRLATVIKQVLLSVENGPKTRTQVKANVLGRDSWKVKAINRAADYGWVIDKTSKGRREIRLTETGRIALEQADKTGYIISRVENAGFEPLKIDSDR